MSINKRSGHYRQRRRLGDVVEFEKRQARHRCLIKIKK